MSRERFRIRYSGEAVSDGVMDVRALAPALLSLGDLCEAANKTLNSPDVKVRVVVHAEAHKGSFEVVLELWQTLPDQVKDLFFDRGSVIGARQLLESIGLVGVSLDRSAIDSLIDLFRWLKGRRPEKILEREDGTVEIHVEGHHNVVSTNVYHLASQKGVAVLLQGTVGPLALPGVDEFDSRGEEDGESQIVTKKDLPSFHMAEIEEASKPDEIDVTSERLLTILKPAFHSDLSWRFVGEDGERFAARMLDEEFQGKVDRREYSFASGDKLLAEVREFAWRDGDLIHHAREILSVRELVQPPEQESID